MSAPEVRIVPAPGARTTTVLVAHHGGARFEATGQEGYSHLLEHLVLRRGRTSGAAAAGTRELEVRGASCNAETTHDLVTFHAQCRAREAPAVLRELAILLGRPLAGEPEIAAEREVVLCELAEHSARAAFAADAVVARAAFPEHPLGRSVLGTPDALTAATRERLAAFRSRWWTGGRSALIITGATAGLPDADELQSLLQLSDGDDRVSPAALGPPRLQSGATYLTGSDGSPDVRAMFLATPATAPLRLRCATAVLERVLVGKHSGLLRLLAGRRGGGAWVALSSATAWHPDCLTMRFGAAGPKLDAPGLGRDCAEILAALGEVRDLENRVTRAVSTSLGEMTLEIDTPLFAARVSASRLLLFDEDPNPAGLLEELATVSIEDVLEVAALLAESPPRVVVRVPSGYERATAAASAMTRLAASRTPPWSHGRP